MNVTMDSSLSGPPQLSKESSRNIQIFGLSSVFTLIVEEKFIIAYTHIYNRTE